MPIYGIYACENTYSGLHGMNKYGFIECDDDKMADEQGIEWSYDVMDSYSSIVDSLEENVDWEQERAEEDDDESFDYDIMMDEVRAENTQWNWTRLRIDCPLTIDELRAREFNEFDELCAKYGEMKG